MSSKEPQTPKENGRRGADQLIVAALAGGCSYDEAALAGGVSKATVKRRMQETEFRIRVGEARVETAERLGALILAASVSAIHTVTELARGAESEAVRLSAARTLLSHAPIGQEREIMVRGTQQLFGAVLKLTEESMSREEHEVFIRKCQALVQSILA